MLRCPGASYHGYGAVDLYRVEVGSGLTVIADLPVDGVAWLAANFEQHWADSAKRDRLLRWVRDTEQFLDLLPVSARAGGRESGGQGVF